MESKLNMIKIVMFGNGVITGEKQTKYGKNGISYASKLTTPTVLSPLEG